MELTKYEHACFTLEKDGKCLVIDPGSLTTDLSISENIIAVIVTHDHADHFSEALLAKITDARRLDCRSRYRRTGPAADGAREGLLPLLVRCEPYRLVPDSRRTNARGDGGARLRRSLRSIPGVGVCSSG